MIDASDKRSLAWLAALPPRKELIVRLALNDRGKDLGPQWGQRVDAQVKACTIDSTGKMVRLLTEVRKQRDVIGAWAPGDG